MAIHAKYGLLITNFIKISKILGLMKSLKLIFALAYYSRGFLNWFVAEPLPHKLLLKRGILKLDYPFLRGGRAGGTEGVEGKIEASDSKA